MSTEKNRDLSKLSLLLATHTAPATATAKPRKARAITPANDNKPAPMRLAWPAFERLAYRGDYARLYGLRHWKAMCHPGSEVDRPEENRLDLETRTEIRPSEAELLVALGWEIIDRERWHETGEVVNIYASKPSTESSVRNRNGGTDTTIGKLTFRDGKLIQWGATKKGAPLKPVERPRGIKGGNEPSRSDSAVWSYLRLRGATSPLTAEPYAKPMSSEVVVGNCYDPLPKEAPNEKDKYGRFGVEEARKVLRDFGIDGGVPFSDLPHGATMCADGLVSGQQWVGGVKKPKPLGEISSAAGRQPEIVRQVETISYLEYLRRHLGDHATVLDLAITDSSATEIGIAMGLSRAYAEKRGASLIDAALDALISIDDTARGVLVNSPTAEKIAA